MYLMTILAIIVLYILQAILGRCFIRCFKKIGTCCFGLKDT